MIKLITNISFCSGTAANYATVPRSSTFNISKKNFGGNMTFHIEAATGGNAYIAMTSVLELMKNEGLIIAAIKLLNNVVSDAEQKFNNFITKGTADFSALIRDAEKSGDLLLIDMLTNFNELVKICIENKTALGNSELSQCSPAPSNITPEPEAGPSKIQIRKRRNETSRSSENKAKRNHKLPEPVELIESDETNEPPMIQSTEQPTAQPTDQLTESTTSDDHSYANIHANNNEVLLN